VRSPGDASVGQGLYAQALHYFRLAETACRSAGNSYQLGQTVSNVAEAQRELGDYGDAAASFCDAIKRHQNAGDRRTASDWLGEAIARTGLGDTYRLLESVHESLAEHQAALAIYRELGSSQRDLVAALDKLAETQLAAGFAAAARESWAEAIRLADVAGNPLTARMQERMHGLGL
jgi:tetratricopeptide (TPR) repeat protein